MANGQSLATQSGSTIARGLKGLIQSAGQTISNPQELLSILTQAAPQTPGLPPMAIDEGLKILKDYYKGAAQELFESGGPDALALALAKSDTSGKIQDALIGTAQPVTQQTKSQASKKSGISQQGNMQAVRSQSYAEGQSSQPVNTNLALEQQFQQPPQTPQAGQEAMAMQSQAEELTPLQVLQQLIQPAGNIFSQAQITPEGKIQKSGILGGLFGTNTTQLLQQLAGIQQLAGKQPLQVGEREKQGLDLQKTLVTELMKQSKENTLKPNDILTKFTQGSKDYIEIRDSFAKLQGALLNPNTNKIDFTGSNPAADLDLLFNTAKTLDPSGRVTDSDIAIQTAATGAYGDKLKKIAQRFKRRGFLAPDERKALYNAAQRRYETMEKGQAKFTSEMKRIAEKNNIDPEKVIFDTGLAQDQTMVSLQGITQAKQRGAVAYDTEKGVFVDSQGREIK